MLHFLFGKNFERATRIVDQMGVKRISAEPSGRSIFQDRLSRTPIGAGELREGLYFFVAIEHVATAVNKTSEGLDLWHRRLGHPSFQVVGESRKKEEYLCFAEHYCGCYSFFFDIVNKGEQLCCKHQLAARLATSTGTCIDVKVSDEELALLLSKI